MSYYPPKKSKPDWFLLTIIIIVLLFVLNAPSEASGADKKVTEGYYGPERIHVVEKPVTAKTGVSRKTGYVGDKRINLRVIRKNEYIETRGWVDGKYINTRKYNVSQPKDSG